MPQCMVPRCKNGNAKRGGLLCPTFTFPRDDDMRELWRKALKMDQTTFIGINSRICAYHFEEECFFSRDENKDDKGRPRKRLRLKNDAVPTVFDFDPGRHKRYARKYAEEPYDDQDNVKLEHCYSEPDFVKEPKPFRFSLPKLTDEDSKAELANVLDEPLFSGPRPGGVDMDIINRYTARAVMGAEKKIYSKSMKDKDDEIAALKKKLEGFEKFFQQDQIKRVSNENVKSWSIEAVTQSLKIRHACGKFGYEYLRSLGYPFPNVVILQDRVHSLEIPAQVLTECSALARKHAEEQEEDTDNEEVPEENIGDNITYVETVKSEYDYHTWTGTSE